jgi:hypothetical protein
LGHTIEQQPVSSILPGVRPTCEKHFFCTNDSGLKLAAQRFLQAGRPVDLNFARP